MVPCLMIPFDSSSASAQYIWWHGKFSTWVQYSPVNADSN